MKKVIIDLTGQRFGRLTVLRRAENRGRRVYWFCACDCGETREILGQNLRNGRVTSCGCWNREKAALRMKQNKTTHGLSKTRLYKIWIKMRERCEAKDERRFRLYSGRGIRVCSEWSDFLAFKNWAESHGYREDLELDRINNDGNYCPENCRWTTRTVQVRNRRNTAVETINGETKSVAEWSEIFGYPYYIGQSRHRRGIPLDRPYIPKRKKIGA